MPLEVPVEPHAASSTNPYRAGHCSLVNAYSWALEFDGHLSAHEMLVIARKTPNAFTGARDFMTDRARLLLVGRRTEQKTFRIMSLGSLYFPPCRERLINP